MKYGFEKNGSPGCNLRRFQQEEAGITLFSRKNINGIHIEQWFHSGGCRQWFNVERNTYTNEISKILNLKNQQIIREKN